MNPHDNGPRFKTVRPGLQAVRSMKRAVARRDGPPWVCCWCEKPFPTIKEGDGSERVDFFYATLEHLIPLASGGKHEIDNCALACAPCNHRRPSSSPLFKRGGTPRPLKFVPALPPPPVPEDKRGVQAIERILSLK